MWLETIADFISSAGIIVVAAAAMQTIAYVFSSQIALRLFLLIGTFLYLVYYFVAADDPLWPAIFGTVCIGITSIYGLLRTLINRSTLTIPRSEMPIYEKIGDIEPGAFRKLMKYAQIKTFESRVLMTEFGVVPQQIYFTLKGDVDVTKSKFSFEIGPNNFIGEISIIGGFSASATVHSRPGTTVVVWNRAQLLDMMKKDERFRIAVEALFSKDMAFKLAQAVKVT